MTGPRTGEAAVERGSPCSYLGSVIRVWRDDRPSALGWGAYLIAAATFAVFQRDWQADLGTLFPDSFAYLRAADHFARHLEFGSDYRFWPPLYPALLAIRDVFPVRLPIAAINGALLVGYVVTAMTLLGCAGIRQGWVFLGGFAVCYATPVRFVYGLVASETLFLTLLLVWTYGWCRFTVSGGERFLQLALVAAGASIFTRYAGLATLPVMIVWFVRKRPSLTPAARIRLSVVAGFTAILALCWVMRNQLVSGTLTGPREVAALRSTAVFFPYFSSTVSNWVIPGSYLHGSNPVALAASVLALGLTLFRPLRARDAVDGTTDDSVMAHQVSAVSGQFAASYLAVLLVAEYSTSIDFPRDRLMAPVFFPVFLALLKALLDVRVRLQTWRLLTGSLIAGWLICPVFAP